MFERVSRELCRSVALLPSVVFRMFTSPLPSDLLPSPSQNSASHGCQCGSVHGVDEEVWMMW